VSKIDDGGSAFPVTAKLMNSGFPDVIVTETTGGMTLRDYFAAAALQGLVVNSHNFDNMTDKSIAENAYLISDAMIEARKEVVK
jgi:hypothetical protein